MLLYRGKKLDQRWYLFKRKELKTPCRRRRREGSSTDNSSTLKTDPHDGRKASLGINVWPAATLKLWWPCFQHQTIRWRKRGRDRKQRRERKVHCPRCVLCDCGEIDRRLQRSSKALISLLWCLIDTALDNRGIPSIWDSHQQLEFLHTTGPFRQRIPITVQKPSSDKLFSVDPSPTTPQWVNVCHVMLA